MSRGKILFQLSGSIACFKACQLLSKIVQNGFEVEVVATKSALEFVGEATLEGLTGRAVHTETFARGQYMSHIHLIRWADLVLLCPASANVINKLARGIGDDLLSTLFLAHDFKKPYLVAPAMNTQMLKHPATQASIEKLSDWGVEFLGSGSGALACGEVGEGRLLEPELLYKEIERRFVPVAQKQLSLLITSGGTREPIDGVRAITNTSTGQTGAALADYFASRGHKVSFIAAQGSAFPAISPARTASFVSFHDLETSLKAELARESFDGVIHAAAVSDYTISEIESEGRRLEKKSKIDSQGDLTLQLKRTPKLVDQIRSLSKNPKTRVIAFKLTNSNNTNERQQAVMRLASHAHPDFIVHNDLHEIDVASGAHFTSIYTGAQDPQKIASAQTKTELAEKLEELLLETLK